jgi:hypothetical protein
MIAPPRPGRRRALQALTCALASPACARHRPAPRPYGHVPLPPERLPPVPLAALPALRSARPIVVSRFDDATSQPVGGAYDEAGGRDAPPGRTYAFAHAALELSERFCDALRAAGLDARLAYAPGPARPPPGAASGAPFARVGGTLLAWQHDVVRTGRGPFAFVHVGRASLRVEAGGTAAAPAFARTWSLEGKVTPGPDGADLLARFGRWAAALVAGDGAFLAAVGASPA